jgi:beta-glucanase (GH16 family)
MEHKGFEPNIIHATLHYTGFSGGGGPTQSTTITNASTEFHTYTVIWTASKIKFYVDNVAFHTFNNDATTPFNANFFIIFNVAMGGTFGGPVDANFVQSTMEVDYVRVYQ